jgi:hypothetical protein
MKKRIGYFHLAYVALFAVFPSIGHTSIELPNLSIAGIPRPDFPAFDNPATIKLTKHIATSPFSVLGFTLTTSFTSVSEGDFSFQSSATSSYNLAPGATFNLTANYGPTGNFIDGNFEIDGNIPSLALNASNVLFKGNLNSYNFDNRSSSIGFMTETSSFQGWITEFSQTTNESIYLYNFNVTALVDLFTNPRFFGSRTFQGTAWSTVPATVPIPRSVWLFCSAVLGILAINSTSRNRFTILAKPA